MARHTCNTAAYPVNSGYGLLKEAERLGILITVEDEEPTRSYRKAWANVLEYVGTADVFFGETPGSRGTAFLVHVNEPQEVLSDYTVGSPENAWIEDYSTREFAARNGCAVCLS